MQTLLFWITNSAILCIILSTEHWKQKGYHILFPLKIAQLQQNDLSKRFSL